MKKEEHNHDCCHEKYMFKRHRDYSRGDSSAIYGMGVIGALFYFLQGAASFSAVVVGIGKAIFWPAVLIFKLLTSMGV